MVANRGEKRHLGDRDLYQTGLFGERGFAISPMSLLDVCNSLRSGFVS